MVVAANGYATVNNCPGYRQLYPNNKAPSDKLSALMTMLEVGFDCSGLCTS